MAQAVYSPTGLSSCSPRLCARPSFVQRFGSLDGGGEGEREGIDFPSTSVGEGIDFPSTSLGESSEELGEVGIMVKELGSTCTSLGGGGAVTGTALVLAVCAASAALLAVAVATAFALQVGEIISTGSGVELRLSGTRRLRRRERLLSRLRRLRRRTGAGGAGGGAGGGAVDALPGL